MAFTKKEVDQFRDYLEELKLHRVGWNFWIKRCNGKPYSWEAFVKWRDDKALDEQLEAWEKFNAERLPY